MSFKTAPNDLNLSLNREDRIVSVLAEGCNGALDANNYRNNYRRYITTVQTRTRLNHRDDVAQKTIQVEVGARRAPNMSLPRVRVIQPLQGQALADAEAAPGANAGLLEIEERADAAAVARGYTPVRASQAFRTNDDFSKYFVGNARRFVGFSGGFMNCDLSALIERLGAAVAHYANYGNLTNAQLRGGANRNPNIIALEFVQQQELTGDDKIFIPTRVSDPIAPNTFAALVYAATGCNATVITDVVNLDPNNNRVVMNDINGVALVQGCYAALSILGALYLNNSRGDLFAYALVRGIHSEVTVVAHTDEGGYTRDVLRRDHFAIPHGGIDIGNVSFAGLPRPATHNQLCYRQIVDAIAIASAACVAIADPLIELDGRVYPTVVTSNDAVDQAGADPLVGAGLQARMAGLIANHSGNFCYNYIRAITYLFGLELNSSFSLGESSRAATHMIGCFTSLARVGTRHSNFNTIAPFFWIEPTGAIRFTSKDFPAIDAGYGPLAFSRCGEMAFDSFEKVANVHNDALLTTFDISWRSARTNALMIHLRAHPLDGLANFVPLALDPNALINIGDQRANVQPDEDIYARMNARDVLGHYMWTQGQSWLPAPGEFIYVGTGIKVQMQHRTYNPNNNLFEVTHTPDYTEIIDNNVVYMSVTPYYSIGLGGLGAEARGVRRARTRAAHSFTNALDVINNTPTMFHDQSISFADVGFTDTRIDERVVNDTNEAYGVPLARANVTAIQVNGARNFGVVGPRMVERPANGPMVNRQVNAAGVANENVPHGGGGQGANAQVNNVGAPVGVASGGIHDANGNVGANVNAGQPAAGGAAGAQ